MVVVVAAADFVVVTCGGGVGTCDNLS